MAKIVIRFSIVSDVRNLLVWILMMVVSIVACSCKVASEKQLTNHSSKPSSQKDTGSNKGDEAMIDYGRELIINTAHYLGPKGTVASLSNGMNCQNCHLKAGTQLYANSYFTVAGNYPKFSNRSGTAETIEHKVNDCMERSLNGVKLDTNSKEMQAMVAYIKWVGNTAQEVPAKAASGTQQPLFLERAADPSNGSLLYHDKCLTCHGQNGEGLLSADFTCYTYPPLWGPHSYNVSAGIYKISKLAGFIKNNMPFGATYQAPQLTDEEAWDIAAFINSQPRNQKIFAADWPAISQKPFDYPFAPYSDHFSEKQHKYGPYQAIVASKKKSEKK